MKSTAQVRRPIASRAAELDSAEAITILSALAQPWRLAVFRLLVRYLPYGLTAGDIARLLALPHNTLSTHLAVLEQAELVRSRREGRSIIFAALVELAAFLAED